MLAQRHTIAPVTVALTPVQQRTLDLLGRSGEPVVFDADVVAELRADLNVGLAELIERLDGAGGATERDIWVTKRGLEMVFTCEASWAAPDEFSWTPARAKGQVAHRAIQLSVHWPGEVVPMTLVDEAIARLADEERNLAEWLATLGPGDVADLRSRAVEHVTKFIECFPPLVGRWHPVTEGTVQYPHSGRIVLRAKPDLTLGTPRGRESRKVIIDVKTGRLLGRHRADLRYYALVETLAREVPPRLLATYSLDSGSADAEEVTVELLRSTLRRTLDGIERMIEIKVEDRESSRTPSVACRWCTLRDACEPGQEFLGADAADD